jgi:hypothetical protein
MIATTRWRKGRKQRHWGTTHILTTCCRRYRTMEAASLRLQKEAKGYLDSLRGGQFIDLTLDLTNQMEQL